MKMLDKIEWPPAGRYLLAVSGGIDSMVMLDVLSRSSRDYELEVGFIDHGWRDVAKDLDLVRVKSSEAGLKLHEASLNLANKSEAAARRGRYGALEKMRVESGSIAGLTAHHADDQIETVVLNLLRGTGRRGLEGMRSEAALVRPFLGVRRSLIEEYAHDQKLQWVDDPTNIDHKYRRNFVRRQILPKLSTSDPLFERDVLVSTSDVAKLNQEIDTELQAIIEISDIRARIKVQPAKRLSSQVIQELIVNAAHQLDPAVELSSDAVEHMAIDLKTGHFNKPRTLTKRLFAGITDGTLTIEFMVG